MGAYYSGLCTHYYYISPIDVEDSEEGFKFRKLHYDEQWLTLL